MPEESKTPSIVRFGPFELSIETGELRKNGIRKKLFGQPIRVLTLLVATPGQLVTREQLQKALWSGDTFTDFERGLNAAISRLRENLDDSATEPKYIETVPGRGYRFIGEIEPAKKHPSPLQADPATRWEGEYQPYILVAFIPLESAVERAVEVVVWVRQGMPGRRFFLRQVIEGPAPLGGTFYEREFPLEVQSDDCGNHLCTHIVLRLDSPNFEPSTQVKKLSVPPGGDSSPCTFLVKPCMPGNLLANLEILSMGEKVLASRSIRTKASHLPDDGFHAPPSISFGVLKRIYEDLKKSAENSSSDGATSFEHQFRVLKTAATGPGDAPIAGMPPHELEMAGATTAEAPLDIAEPTLGDIYSGGPLGRKLGDSLQRFFTENKDLDNMDLPMSKVIDRLPKELQGPVCNLVTQHDRRTSAIRAAIRQEAPSDGSLEIVSVAATREAEFDVKMRNLSSDTIYITRIGLRILRDEGSVLPVIRPSAKYKIPIGSLAVGETTSLDVSHTIEPHGADRFLIALESTRVVYVRLTFEYNRQYSVSENAWLWKSVQDPLLVKLQKIAARRSASERWSAATPPCLKSSKVTMVGALSRDEIATLLPPLEAAYPDQNTRIRTLLAWFGSGAGPWSGFPSYEAVPEKLLLTFPLDDLLRALEFPELTDAHLEGAARLFGDWTFRTKWKQGLARLPEPLRITLLKHCMASTDSDKRLRAQAAFDPP